GHVVCTRAHVGSDPVLGLGPIAVRTALQRRGIGSALMEGIISAADQREEQLIGLLGAPGYYRRFGFIASTEFGIDPPVSEWGKAFQVRTLDAYDLTTRGTFRYAEPFDRV
ncbi:MAG: GNAT family N-acetyltransferase, partial [Acidimicrobiia bacterium]